MMDRAISFSFWKTLAIEGSADPGRMARGLLPIDEAYEAAYLSYAGKRGIQTRLTTLAVRAEVDAFEHVYEHKFRTPLLVDRVREVLSRLSLTYGPQEKDLVAEISQIEARVAPKLVDGAFETLQRLHASDWRIALVSDVRFTPGSLMRGVYQRLNIAQFLTASVFSDEEKVARPDPRIFEATARKLDVGCRSLIHVGSDLRRDIRGAKAAGAHNIYVGSETSSIAEGVAADLRVPQLSAIGRYLGL